VGCGSEEFTEVADRSALGDWNNRRLTAGDHMQGLRPLKGLLFGATVISFCSGLQIPARADTTISVYCSILEEQCREGVAMFERANPGIKVAMVRKSTGEAYAQIRAEAANPKADVWWGGPAESHLQAGEEGLLDSYKSPALAELHDWAQRLSEQSSGRTAGIYLGALGIGYNEEILKKKGIAPPRCWSDLLDPRLKDEVQMADPNSSGTAYVMVATVVQLMGEEKAFEYMKALHRNISQYTKSGIAPVKAVGSGETSIAIAFMHDLITQKLSGAPVAVVAPCEGTGYETGAVSLVKGLKAPAEARRFFDFALSREAQEINVRLKINSVPSNRSAAVSPDAPKFSEIKLIAYDTGKYGSAAERKRLLTRWTQEVQAAPK
jgi:iron(III) transport system substrate-binding protein